MKRIQHQELILVLVKLFSGKATWYGLERALNSRGLINVNLISIAKQLLKEGLIEEVIGEKPGLPYWSITDLGETRVDEIIKIHGIEPFSTGKKSANDYE